MSRKSSKSDGIRQPRSAEDRARDRAINRAITRAGDGAGPIIVRLGKGGKTEHAPNVPDNRLGPAKDRASLKAMGAASNSLMADALLAAGIKVEPSDDRPAKTASKKNGAARPTTKKTPKKEPKAKPTTKHQVKRSARKKKPATPAHSATGGEEERTSKRQKRFLAELRKKAATMQGGLTPANLRWQERQREITDLIRNIESASFATLASAWKKHVTLAGYIEDTGRNSERLPSYIDLIAAIEREWGRRVKLAFNSDEYFDWPSTHAGRGRKGIADINWAAEGFLSYLGYHVGESSDLTDHARRAILRRTFKMILPPLESSAYVKSWGPPSSAPRLKKMAHSLASFARSAKARNASGFVTAIDQWEADLAMLREEFYVAKFGFGWPQV